MGKYSWSDQQDSRREERRPTPPARQPIKTSQKPIPKKSQKRKDQEPIYMAERALHLMLNPCCQVPGCQMPATEIHHSKGRVGNLYTDRQYFKSICSPHHQYYEIHPEEAKAIGISYSRLSIE